MENASSPTVFINSRDTPENLVSQNNTQSDKSNSPIKPTKIYGLTGIINTGNTCYMNSAIQAISHNYPLTNYLFHNKDKIYEILKMNARKILKDSRNFKIDNFTSIVPLELRKKIQDENYHQSMLTTEEETIVFNHTITVQLMRLLENMWARNCIVIPTSFRKIFSEARDKFFFGFE